MNLTTEEKELLETYQQLNDTNKAMVIKYGKYLLSRNDRERTEDDFQNNFDNFLLEMGYIEEQGQKNGELFSFIFIDTGLTSSLISSNNN